MRAGRCVTLRVVNLAALAIPAVMLLAASSAGTADLPWDTWQNADAVSIPGDRFDFASLQRMLSSETNPAKIAGLAAIRMYQVLLSPGMGGRCQFHPSCSRYTFAAIRECGLLNGTVMGAERILRCNGHAQLGGYPESPEDGLLEDSPAGKPVPLPMLSVVGL